MRIQAARSTNWTVAASRWKNQKTTSESRKGTAVKKSAVSRARWSLPGRIHGRASRTAPTNGKKVMKVRMGKFIVSPQEQPVEVKVEPANEQEREEEHEDADEDGQPVVLGTTGLRVAQDTA